MAEIKSGWFIVSHTVLKPLLHGVFDSKESATEYGKTEIGNQHCEEPKLLNYVLVNNKIQVLGSVDIEIPIKTLSKAEIKIGWFVELFSDGSAGHVDQFVGVFTNKEEAENFAYNVHVGSTVMDIFDCEYIERGTEIQVLRYMNKGNIIKR